MLHFDVPCFLTSHLIFGKHSNIAALVVLSNAILDDAVSPTYGNRRCSFHVVNCRTAGNVKNVGKHVVISQRRFTAS